MLSKTSDRVDELEKHYENELGTCYHRIKLQSIAEATFAYKKSCLSRAVLVNLMAKMYPSSVFENSVHSNILLRNAETSCTDIDQFAVKGDFFRIAIFQTKFFTLKTPFF